MAKYKRIWNLVKKQKVIAMMQKLTTNLLNNKLNKLRCNFTIECSEQIWKFPIFTSDCPMLTAITSIDKQPSYTNPIQHWWFTSNFKNLKSIMKIKINKTNNRNMVSKNQMSMFFKAQMLFRLKRKKLRFEI